ncbi:hypothetical protein [Caballeronia sordidicola]|nr:hypothetical protein [Caballeronia sordidicola]
MKPFTRHWWVAAIWMIVCLAGIALLVMPFVGGNVYHAAIVKLFDKNGAERYTFKQGEWVYVRRDVCADKSIFSSLSPVLFDVKRRAIIPLADYSLVVKPGCDERGAGFQIPPGLPPGPYEYRNTVRFQNNLIGRDEAQPYAPINLTVTE